jgi:hypothetical protein
MNGRRLIAALALSILATTLSAAPRGSRRALLIGINDYSAAPAPGLRDSRVPARDWTNLDGAVNDVRLMREILVARHGFASADIVTLTDQEATRAAILKAIDSVLGSKARKGDVLLFYYSGHGSQVRNSLSAEADKLDESIVPADSRRGAPDIRDKELSVAFNRLLDSGARLTVVLDACHSGSGARGLTGGLRHRSVKPDLRDVADPTNAPRPEDRGALVISAAEDFDLAYETIDDKTIRGAFSWAFARALRDARPGEAAGDTFLRAQAVIRAEMPAQNPVLAGRAGMRDAPLLSNGDGRPASRDVAVESVSADGTFTLLGGWAHGLTVGTRLRPPGQESGTELEVTSLIGAGRALARAAHATRDATRDAPRDAPRDAAAIRAGALLEIATWAAPSSRKLRVWIPRATLAVVASAHCLLTSQSIDDPTETTPAHVVRWRDERWETVGEREAGDTQFVQLPATPGIASAADGVDAIQVVTGPETADYILAGRITANGAEYAWVRPGALANDAARSPMPPRSAWTSAANEEQAALVLREALLRLARVLGWHELQSPNGDASAYRIALREARHGTPAGDGPLIGGGEYRIVLQLRDPTRPVYTRYVYAFAIDSRGQSTLLFPRLERGSVENRLPLTDFPAQPVANPPREIVLGDRPSFVVTAPYGLDTYFLLFTDTPLSGTSCLEWGGVRSLSGITRSPLETLLAQSGTTRGDGAPLRTSPNWSIEKLALESIPPKKGRS